MNKKKRYTIKDLADSKVVLLNDGTIAELKAILSAASPGNPFNIEGTARFYYFTRKDLWSCTNIAVPNIPVQSVKEFIKDLEDNLNDDRFPHTVTLEEAFQIVSKVNQDIRQEVTDKFANVLVTGSIEVYRNTYLFLRENADDVLNTILDDVFWEEEEECPYEDGELIFVKRNIDNVWQLRYSTGKMKDEAALAYFNQDTKGSSLSWKVHAPAKGVKLPD